jgi:acyl-CoA thioester hydrolase
MSRLSIDLPGQFLFRTDIPVRISDVNYGGHLGNDAVLSIAQEARIRMLKEYGYSELDIEGVGLIMADAAVLYRSEAFHGEILTVEVGVNDVQIAGCDLVYRITEKTGGREVALVKTGLVFYNYAAKKVARMPEKFRFWMRSHSVEG